MSQIRTGWTDLYVAQVLWAKMLAQSHGCQIGIAPPSAQSVGLVPENAPELHSDLREELGRLANRVQLVANCTCDVCGKHAFAGTRCIQHRDAPPSCDSADIDEIWNATDNPMQALERMASFNGAGAAKAWIWQIARNCLTDHQRKIGTMANHETAVNDEQWEHLENTTADPNAAICRTAGSVDECVSAGLESFGSREPERALVLLLQMDCSLRINCDPASEGKPYRDLPKTGLIRHKFHRELHQCITAQSLGTTA